MDKLAIHPMSKETAELVAEYWANSSDEAYWAMGADPKFRPTKKQMWKALSDELEKPIEEKNALCVIWYCNDVPVGHSNTNPTKYSEEAFMHLHIWNPNFRKKGIGTSLLQMSASYFLKALKLKVLYCQPKAENLAPNNCLQKCGFEFVEKKYCIPGKICYPQFVNLYKLTAENALKK